MKMLFAFAVATGLSTTALASGWDGTWHGDIKAYKPPAKVVTRLLKNGHYTSDASVPPRDIAADGKYHAVKGDPYADEMMVVAVDKATVKQAMRQRGKDMSQSVISVDPDGQTMTIAYTDMTAPGGTVTGTNKAMRVAASPPGSHAISGQWKSVGIVATSANNLDVTLKDTGKTLSLSTPTGVAYTAVYGGPAVPLKGDPSNIMVAVKRTGPDTIVETDSRGGKVISVQTMKLSPDGKTIVVSIDDKENGTTAEWTTHKK